MKKIRASTIACLLIFVLQLAAEGWLGYSLLRLGMLPTLYAAALIGVLVLLLAVTGVMMFVRGRGKRVSLVRRIIAIVLAVLVMAGCGIVIKMASEFHATMDRITTPVQIGPTRNIYVLAEDPAQTIQDAADYTFGMVSGYDESCSGQVIEAVEKELGSQIRVQTFEGVTQMLDALYEKQVDTVILNGAYLSLLEDDMRYMDFGTVTRVLHTVPVTESGAAEPPVIEPDTTPNITNTPFVVYLSGIDVRSDTLVTSRSDVNILMVVNPTTKQILMINTPRDYYIVHPWGSGTRDKLTHCGIYGVDCSIQALQNLYGIQVDYYAQINFTGFERLINAIGGVTVYSDRAFTTYDEVPNPIYIQKGDNLLNGTQALAFARDRYNQPGGDNGRGQNQMKVIQAAINKVTSATTLIANYSEILKSVEGVFTTSMQMEDISKLVRMQLTDMASWNVQTYAVTGYGDTKTTYSMPGLAAYVMHPNQSTVDHASALAQKVIDGEILSSSDMSLS